MHTFEYIYIYIYIYDMSDISLSVISFLNELKIICLPTCIAIVSTYLNGFNYCYLILIILLIIDHLFAQNEVDTSIAI